jgi:hypothetical protein
MQPSRRVIYLQGAPAKRAQDLQAGTAQFVSNHSYQGAPSTGTGQSIPPGPPEYHRTSIAMGSKATRNVNVQPQPQHLSFEREGDKDKSGNGNLSPEGSLAQLRDAKLAQHRAERLSGSVSPSAAIIPPNPNTQPSRVAMPMMSLPAILEEAAQKVFPDQAAFPAFYQKFTHKFAQQSVASNADMLKLKEEVENGQREMLLGLVNGDDDAAEVVVSLLERLH